MNLFHVLLNLIHRNRLLVLFPASPALYRNVVVALHIVGKL